MASDDLSRVLEDVLPQLRRLQLKAWFRLVVLAAGAVTLGWMLTDGGRQISLALPVIALMLLLFTGLSAGILRFHQQKMLLPAVAGAFALSHQKNDDSFVSALPRKLLPREGRKYVADDVFSGEIAGQKIRFGEVRAVSRKADDSPKGDRPGFQGLVFELALVGEVSPLLIADKYHTTPEAGTRAPLDTEEAPLRDSYRHLHADYGLWAVSNERQRSRRDLLQGLVNLAPEVFDNRAFVWSAVIEAQKLTIALSYNSNLFQLGGLLTRRSRLMRELRRSGDDLARMMRFANGAMRPGQALASQFSLPE